MKPLTLDDLADVVLDYLLSKFGFCEQKDAVQHVRSYFHGEVTTNGATKAVDYLIDQGLVTRRVSDFDGLTTLRTVN